MSENRPYYQDAYCTLYHADCLEALPLLETDSFDLVVTSPPYNLGGGPWPHLGNWKPGDSAGGKTKWQNGSDAGAGIQYGTHSDSMPWSQYVDWQQSVIKLLWRKLPYDGAIFYNHKPRVVGAKLWTPLELIPEDVVLRQIIVWARPGGMNFNPTAFVPTHEWIMLLAQGPFRLKSKAVSGMGDVWRMSPETNSHPAPFPLELPRRVIEATKSMCILDPFAGSGTTLRAAKDLGRRSIGIEIEERYCEMAAKRLEQGVLEFGQREALGHG